MDKTESQALAKQYASVAAQEIHPDKILLFEFYAKGTATDESDMDVAVIVNNFSGDRLQTYTRIAGLCRKVSSYIEPVLLDSADGRSGFLEEIAKHGELLYEQQLVELK
ncbi:MAG: nucleotidyltransferase domain-containing protein [Desulfovibrio sp.]|jgi:predicted nucleotidyltransferase|nr:nucleotidyltransferase domain-containing protein [Desulfovibrio sp.]